MRIFYTASYYGKTKYQKFYDLVLDAIQQQGVEVISPELGNYQSVLTQSEKQQLVHPDLIHYAAIKKGIEVSDAIIIELSHQDFQIGWEANLACQTKKPVLCLSMYEDFSQKIKHRFFHAAKYDEYTIDNLIANFIQRAAKNHLNQKFNFFLSPTQLKYVKDQAESRRLTAAEFIRELIDKHRFDEQCE